MTNQEFVQAIVNDVLAKSRYYKYSFINLSTGVYISTIQASELISLETEIHTITFDSPKQKVETIIKALHLVGFISKLQAEALNVKLLKWAFFDDFFSADKCGVKIPIISLYVAYCEKVVHVNHKQFYSELNSWVKENQYNVNFINRLAQRKIILVR